MDTAYPPPNARSFIRGPSAGRVWLNHGQFGDRDIEKDAYDGEPATHRMAYNYRMRLKDSKGNIIQVIIHEQILVDLRDEPDARRKAGQRLRKPPTPAATESAPVGGPGAPEITASGRASTVNQEKRGPAKRKRCDRSRGARRNPSATVKAGSGPGKRPTRRGNRGGRKSGRTP